ncbi:uncharacterized protein LOC128889278 [Hylaeus anthracinus]|uniref:uncharacterized protein LOC128889278 n=1 Tax=Hylaeus anthracinus TaxID=313031 RepID=UPI0023B8F04A|nr:uncharacterized protein LOC128889278 [Hylaeus anthracinus]
MSQPNNTAQPRKKLAKCTSTSASGQNSNHKLKRIASTSTYIVNNEEGQERAKSATLENASVDPRKNRNLVNKRVDKTTSSTTVNGGRKFWNPCNAKPSNLFLPDHSIIEEESEVISALTKQLYLVESQMHKVQSSLRRSEEQLRSKDQEIGRLKRKVKEWETKSKNQETLRKKEQQQRRVQTDRSDYLYSQCLMLEHRIYEMEKFLADYGLIWVGDTNSPKCHEPVANNYIGPCYEQIIANIDQLNLAAGKGEVHVQHNEKGNGATFKTPSCMSLKFYKNGMIVQDGLLRPYDDPATESFLRDILDGYFPSELQQAYPNGVPFKVEDHRHQMYLGSTADFPGQGYRLGKQPPADNNSLLSSRTRRPGTASQKSSRRPSLTKDNLSSNDCSTPLVPSTARSLKSKSPSVDTPPIEMYILRSQILASHNNNCSDTHLQSHINAELGLSSRKEKRDLATKTADFDVTVREGLPKSRGVLRFPSSGRCYHGSTDRSSSRPSPSRFENTEDRTRQRTRSASLPSSRMSVNPKPITRTKPATDFAKVDATRFSNLRTTNSATKRNPRVTKSAAPVRKNAPPILHQINEPSGTPGELRLKVRSLNGGTVYLVHVSADEPIAQLYHLLDRAMSRTVPRGYKIVLSGYSPRRLEHLGTTLREIGITRDSVLHLVND